jgi:GTP diphosphokinase / guanosine-3',5'-bis(diphosphate) 3'-diphosphatase
MNLAKAISIAATEFENKTDKAGQPYILHCLRVMNNLNSTDEELNIIAVLHDIREDCGYTTKQLYDLGFSERVVRALAKLTHFESQYYGDYIEEITGNIDAIKVKMADLIDNMNLLRLSKISKRDLERQEKYFNAYNRLKYCVE